MAEGEISLSWSATFVVAASQNQNIPGDKILLPPSALEQLLSASTVTTTSNAPRAAFDPFNPYSIAQARHEQSQWRDTQQQLPHPLTFRLVNPSTGNVVHAGIREFSAEEGQIVLSPFLMAALNVKESDIIAPSKGSLDAPIDLTDDEEPTVQQARITVHAKQLPKGTYVRLRPLEAGYNPDDWKSLLERHMRENYTTLTNGEIFSVPGSRDRRGTEFRFLIDKFVPAGDGICVVDTDLEVDIEALNEEQARETLKQIISKAQRAPVSAEGSSSGGVLDIWNPIDGQVVPGEYVDYQLPSWDRSQPLEIELSTSSDDEVDLFISPLSTYQRSRPREDEYVLCNVDNEKQAKRIRIEPTNVVLESCEALYISIRGYPSEDSQDTRPLRYTIRAKTADKSVDLTIEDAETHSADAEQCKNCHQWVPKRTMMLHENFCLRNNILCPHCQEVFKKNSSEWQAHWHCPHDSSHGNSEVTKKKHDHIFHNPQQCTGCPYTAKSLPELAAHRTTVCPSKHILCQFCHLEVPQEGDPFSPSADQLLSGLTAHELADGSRTTNCHLCDAIVRLRDMTTHLKHHDLSRQAKALPRICRNVNCGRTLDGVGKNGEVGKNNRMGQGSGNELGLCSICFGPLYVSMHDPEGKAMRRRIERRYLGQLITGCGKSWCNNIYCKLGKVNAGVGKHGEVVTTKDALPMIKPLIEHVNDTREPMYFCVDEGSQKRRVLAEMLAAESIYDFEWCIAACEGASGSFDGARTWLKDWAPKKGEGRS